MSIQPLGDRVLVEILETEEKTASGIVLPESAKEKKAEGKVVAIGNGGDVQELNLSEGDIVLFGRYAGDDVELEGVEYKILKDDEVLAVVK